jgi:hypothetical protein
LQINIRKDYFRSNHRNRKVKSFDMTRDETIYLNAARGGDQEAFAQLIDPYRKQILVHWYRILGSFEDAEDMLQENLVRVWKRLDSFEGRSSLCYSLYFGGPAPSVWVFSLWVWACCCGGSARSAADNS